MWPFNRRAPENRGATFTQAAPQTFAELVGLMDSGSLPVVNSVTAMQLPAFSSGVNFIAGTLAGLPLHVYERNGSERTRVSGPIATILHDAVSPEMTSFDWRKYMFERVLTGGRGITQIQRDRVGRIAGLFPLDPREVTIKRTAGSKRYIYKENGAPAITLQASEVIDIPFMLKEDGLNHWAPLEMNKKVLQLGLAAQEYAAKYFNSGGVPPFAVSGNFQSGQALNRAGDDLEAAVKKASEEGRTALTLPDGLTITRLGTDPDKSQLLETQKFVVEQIARMLSLPPTFLQDLQHGTYSNTEQQDLHFVKHTLKRWVEQFEQELNLKLFPGTRTKFVEFEMDGLMRGDFKSRMEGYAQGIQNAIHTPNEVRRRENLPDHPEGNALMVQGATVPIGTQPKGNENEA